MARLWLTGLFCLLILLPAGTGASPLTDGLDTRNLQLASVHSAVVDLETGSQIHGKHAQIPVPIASITKIMTALVVLESDEPLDEYLTILERDRPAPVNAYSRIRIDSEATRRDLVRIALMASENLAAHQLARHHPGGYEAFIEAMNRKATLLGMNNSQFVDPAGLSSKNQSTASDLTRLMRAAWENETLRELSTTRYHTVHFRSPRYQLRYGNTNVLVHRRGWPVRLTKTGYLNDAGRCLMMVTQVDDRPVGMVFLNSFGKRTPLGDAGRVRRWLRTGNSGAVAGAAKRYEHRQVQALKARETQTAENTHKDSMETAQ
ncbi:D-alanyl-D-alanine endopeptidase [Halovibrio salipaludis]|uniref:D-alanyl-D-alanine endopeptidase n=1 Tax=Halovibrio salipaludis TaxID=2032626 RepID=A0A2A2EZQ2_9GAMM|nr:D-alanyl-D-alanine endopeptidase [Halovibrio salipaludis]PAU77822.1 D-alanyl-D-alanine endopeptidase [Halovibrio salipaludis]